MPAESAAEARSGITSDERVGRALSAVILVTFVLALGVGCRQAGSDAESGADNSDPVSFVEEIKPLLEHRCLACHNTTTLLGRLNLENRELAFSHPEGGQFVVPGNAKASKMYQVLLLPRDDDAAMPAAGHRLADEEVDLIRRWIDQGAEWPDGREGVLTPLVPDSAE